MKTKQLLLCLTIPVVLAACSGGDGNGAGPGTITAAEGPQSMPLRFGAQVTFGDSLSDVGSYAVGAIGAAGGGKFTINGDRTQQYPELVGRIWNEMLAAQFGLPAPCAAQTGLQGDPLQGLSAPVVAHPGCFNYAQGGARVVEPVGPGNRLAGSPIGQLTLPVAAQVANHLATIGGRFQGNELVFVMAGANDIVVQWGELSRGAAAAAQAAGPAGAAEARAAYLAAYGPAAIAAAGAAANGLVAIVLQQIVAAGANYVVVNNVPDLAGTPLGGIQEPQLRALVQAMLEEFNRVLKAGLDPEAKVAQVDIYSLFRDALANPLPYGLSNTRAPACGPNALQGHSLMCTVWNTYPVDVSHFMFADTVHPTPYGHWLMARVVQQVMSQKGWATPLW